MLLRHFWKLRHAPIPPANRIALPRTESLNSSSSEIPMSKSPISYANAFLKPVEGADLMAESATTLAGYRPNAVAKAYAPADMRRALLAINSASVDMAGAQCADTLGALVSALAGMVKEGDAA